MPHFYFHVYDGRGLLDEEGTAMPDAQAAGIAAICFAGEVLKDHAAQVSSNGGCRIEVTDSSRHTLFQLSFVVLGSSGLGSGLVSGPREWPIDGPDVGSVAE